MPAKTEKAKARAPLKRERPGIKPVVINLADDFLAEIDDYRYANRFDSRTKAIRDLLAKGLRAK
jgi:metal-responsive CopG/Arc/MetJ family transcriptional regulator